MNIKTPNDSRRFAQGGGRGVGKGTSDLTNPLLPKIIPTYFHTPIPQTDVEHVLFSSSPALVRLIYDRHTHFCGLHHGNGRRDRTLVTAISILFRDNIRHNYNPLTSTTTAIIFLSILIRNQLPTSIINLQSTIINKLQSTIINYQPLHRLSLRTQQDLYILNLVDPEKSGSGPTL